MERLQSKKQDSDSPPPPDMGIVNIRKTGVGEWGKQRPIETPGKTAGFMRKDLRAGMLAHAAASRMYIPRIW